MKILITGGHLSPALAIIDRIKDNATIEFVGRRYSFESDKTETLEYKEIRKRDISFHELQTARLKRDFSFHTITSFIKLPGGMMQALRIIDTVKPDVIVSFGGYLSVPIAFAGKLRGVPVIIHEQTLDAGLANKLISKFATRICVSWDTSFAFFPKDRTVLTGNPLKVFANTKFPFIFEKKDEHLPLLYITGGSTGSHAINVLIEDVLPKCVEKFRMLHQTGDAQEFGDFDRLQRKKDSLPERVKNRYQLEKFIPATAVSDVYKNSSIIISRSGINTITELIYFEKYAILIPLPYGQKNEQTKNALFAKKLGIAEVLEQHNATPDVLMSLLDAAGTRYDSTKSVSEKTQSILIKEAAEKIISVIYEVAQQKNDKKNQRVSTNS